MSTIPAHSLPYRVMYSRYYNNFISSNSIKHIRTVCVPYNNLSVCDMYTQDLFEILFFLTYPLVYIMVDIMKISIVLYACRHELYDDEEKRRIFERRVIREVFGLKKLEEGVRCV